MMIINPGSDVAKGSYEVALANAKRWYESMKEQGFVDIEMSEEGVYDNDGRWRFEFKHKITGVSVPLDMHGLTDEEVKKLIFPPRIYWNESSCASPDLEDWLKEGYRKELKLVESK